MLQTLLGADCNLVNNPSPLVKTGVAKEESISVSRLTITKKRYRGGVRALSIARFQRRAVAFAK
jgi:hypothetical protein